MHVETRVRHAMLAAVLGLWIALAYSLPEPWTYRVMIGGLALILGLVAGVIVHDIVQTLRSNRSKDNSP